MHLKGIYAKNSPHTGIFRTVVVLCAIVAISIVVQYPLTVGAQQGAEVKTSADLVESNRNIRRTEFGRSGTPSSGGGSLSVTPTPDPDLEPGFPVYTDAEEAGTYSGGPAMLTLVGNIDDQPDLEIVVTALANGPLFAWKSNGSLVPGWPVSDIDGAGYPAMGNLSATFPGLEVFSVHRGLYPAHGRLFGYAGNGSLLPGWPRSSANFIREAPSLADVDRDGIDEIFTGEEDRNLYAYRADGSVLPGWPAFDMRGGQTRNTPAIADIDGDGDLEILTMSQPSTPGGVYLFAYHHDGTPVAGFPVQDTESLVIGHIPSIGDVDGDGSVEIVVASHVPNQGGAVKILSGNGTTERIIPNPRLSSLTVLADLDGDTIPEIIMQGEAELTAFKGDGTLFPGWPRVWATGNTGRTNSVPVVGDVDGDGQPDIVVLSGHPYSGVIGHVRAYDRFGNSLRGFPKEIPIGGGAVPAIADIDLDGRNEIIVTGRAWDGGY